MEPDRTYRVQSRSDNVCWLRRMLFPADLLFPSCPTVSMSQFPRGQVGIEQIDNQRHATRTCRHKARACGTCSLGPMILFRQNVLQTQCLSKQHEGTGLHGSGTLVSSFRGQVSFPNSDSLDFVTRDGTPERSSAIVQVLPQAKVDQRVNILVTRLD